MKVIGIYPGNFQPAHRGHVKVYKKLRQIVGTETFIATPSRTPTPDAPLHFGEKENIWVRHGVPASHIVKVEDWKHPREIFQKFSPSHTSAVFALNPKEVEELHVVHDHDSSKEVWTNADGSPSYFQPYKGNEASMKTLDKHGYVQVVDDNIIDGKPISTSNVRSALGSAKYTEEQKKRFFVWVFGWFDIGLFHELADKFKMAHTTNDSEQQPVAMPSLASLVRSEKPTPVPTPNANKLRAAVHEIVKEIMEDMIPSPLMTPQGDESESDAITLPGEEQRTKDVMKTRQDAMKQKSASERDLKTLKTDLKWKESDIKRKKQDEIPNKRKEIDTLNKAISSGKLQ